MREVFQPALDHQLLAILAVLAQRLHGLCVQGHLPFALALAQHLQHARFRTRFKRSVGLYVGPPGLRHLRTAKTSVFEEAEQGAQPPLRSTIGQFCERVPHHLQVGFGERAEHVHRLFLALFAVDGLGSVAVDVSRFFPVRVHLAHCGDRHIQAHRIEGPAQWPPARGFFLRRAFG